MSQDQSFLRHCHIIGRPGDYSMFVEVELVDGEPAVAVRLERYTILPTEQYDRLNELAEIGAATLASELLNAAARK